jgi:hypothetical protein
MLGAIANGIIRQISKRFGVGDWRQISS